jgi:hypothetical protein
MRSRIYLARNVRTMEAIYVAFACTEMVGRTILGKPVKIYVNLCFPLSKTYRATSNRSAPDLVIKAQES